MNSFQELKEKIEKGTARMGVLGMGYVGLPLAVVFAEAGYSVTGIDLNQEKVDSVNKGTSYIPDIDTSRLKKMVDSGKITATSDSSVLKDLDLVSICVPTPLRKTGDPDLSFIHNAAEMIAPYLHKGMAVVLESSTYPGTTRDMMYGRFCKTSSLEEGKDYFLAFSPERVDPGRKDFTTKNTPKVIGGMTPEGTEIVSLWYGKALDKVIPVSSPEVAEMAKLLENTFRMINIGLVNELAIMCRKLGIDVWEVIEAAGTKPFGFMKFKPGPGLGGHCIPIDPLYLSWKMKSLNYTARFIDLASEINTEMPSYVVSLTQDALNDVGKPIKNSKILVLGVTYKPDIDDMRESPAIDVIYLLNQKGGNVSYYDPYVPKVQVHQTIMTSITDLDKGVKESDCVMIVTNHSCFDYARILREASLIVDTRNALGNITKNNPKVVKL